MNDTIDDRDATAIAHDSAMARVLSASAASVATAWRTSAVHRRAELVTSAFRALPRNERIRYGAVALVAAVATRLLLSLL